MSKKEESKEVKEKNPNDPYQKYKDFKWEDADEFKNGPIGDENRKCRDVLCCIIFFAFLLACVFVGLYSYDKGDPNIILFPYDDDGNQCGRGLYKDYKYIYFYKAKEDAKKVKLGSALSAFCVSDCFQEKLSDTETEKVFDCKPTKLKTDCSVSKENYYTSRKFIGRFCIPWTAKEEEKYDPIEDEKNQIKGDDGEVYVKYDVVKNYVSNEDSANQIFNLGFFSTSRFSSWMSDLFICWKAIAASVVWSFVICLIFLLFIRCCAAFLIYAIILLILAAFIILGVVFHRRIDYYEGTGEDTYKTTMEVLQYVCFGIAAVWFLFILCMCNKIRLSVALLEATAKYIHNNCCINFVPFLFFILTAIWYAYWIISAIYICSIGELKKTKIFPSIEWDKKTRYLFWFHFFSLLYMNEFLKAFAQFIYASSACIWYFTHEKGTEDHPIAKSFKRACRYHCGSLAFGSLIVAIIKFIMYMLEGLKKKIDKTYGDKSKAGCIYKCIIRCLQCFMECIARTMEFINKHAYIQIALKGDNFCTAAWEGFGLIIRNLGRFSTLILLGSFFTLFGMLFIAAGSAVIGYYVITKVDMFSEDLNSPVLPVVAMALIGLIIGSVTMSVYGMSSDALLHSFLLDEELNKGQAKAFPELQKFMNNER